MFLDIDMIVYLVLLLVLSLTLNVARMTLCTFCLLVALNTSHITAATGYLRRKVTLICFVCLFVFVIRKDLLISKP